MKNLSFKTSKGVLVSCTNIETRDYIDIYTFEIHAMCNFEEPRNKYEEGSADIFTEYLTIPKKQKMNEQDVIDIAKEDSEFLCEEYNVLPFQREEYEYFNLFGVEV